MKITVSATPSNTKNILTLIEEMGYSLPCNCRGAHHCSGAQYSFDCSMIPKATITVTIPDAGKNLHGISLEDKICVAGNGNCLLIDIGTTTVALALIDSDSGELRQTTVFANPQRTFGTDVISRIQSSLEGHKNELKTILQHSLQEETEKLCQINNQTSDYIKYCFIGGNTAMIHLLLGYDCTPLAASPFQIKEQPPEPLLINGCKVTILPWISAFVGGDITAGIYACPFTACPPSLFIDLGTNGEMLLHCGETLFAASTAAGPAFEGNGLSCGCPGIPGAVSAVKLRRLRPAITTIGNKLPIGICGSGAISLMAELLHHKYVTTDGILTQKFPDEGILLGLSPKGTPIRFTADDFRSIQLAVAAIGAGIDTLCHEADIDPKDIISLYLGGGFGFYLDLSACRDLGLFSSVEISRVIPMGNTCLRGLYEYACRNKSETPPDIPPVTPVSLADSSFFRSRFISHMTYPDIMSGNDTV